MTSPFRLLPPSGHETMKSSPIEISVEDFEPQLERSKGIHVSQCIKRLLVKMDPKKYGGEGFDRDRMFVGFLWEEVMSAAFARLARSRDPDLEQVEVEVDGLIGTIDGYDAERGRVREFKATWISSRNPIDSHRFWHWMVQVKAYCYMTGTLEADLFVLFVDGDYKPRKRIPKAWVLRFTEQEVVDNWRLLQRVMRQIEEEEEAA